MRLRYTRTTTGLYHDGQSMTATNDDGHINDGHKVDHDGQSMMATN